jgi:hypothetical protein
MARPEAGLIPMLAIVLLEALAWPSAVRAAEDHESAPVAFRWKRAPGAETCPDREAIMRGVRARLGRRVFVAEPAAQVTIRGEIRRTEEGWQARLVLDDRDGTRVGSRTIDSDRRSCASLEDTIALVLALMVDVAKRHIRLHVPELDRPSEPRPRPAASSTWGAHLSLAGSFSAGLLPGVSYGPVLRIGVATPGGWSLAASARGLAGSQARRQEGGGARLFSWTAGIGVCPPPLAAGPLRLRACAGAEAGQIHARGFDLPRTEEVARPFALAAGGLHLAWPLPALWELGLSLEALVPWWRDRFAVRGEGGEPDVLHRPTAVGVAVALGVGVRFD